MRSIPQQIMYLYGVRIASLACAHGRGRGLALCVEERHSTREPPRRRRRRRVVVVAGAARWQDAARGDDTGARRGGECMRLGVSVSQAAADSLVCVV